MHSEERLTQLVRRPLGPADLPAVMDLHVRACAGISDQVVRPETEAFFAHMLGGGAVGEGLYDPASGALIAYGLLQTDLRGEEALMAALPAAVAGLRAGKLAGAAVDPAWRGHRLQAQLALRRLAVARNLELDYVFSTSSPQNPASYRSLLHAGLMICARSKVYGGYARYLLIKPVMLDVVLHTNETVILSDDSEETIISALHKGAWVAATAGCLQAIRVSVMAGAAPVGVGRMKACLETERPD